MASTHLEAFTLSIRKEDILFTGTPISPISVHRVYKKRRGPKSVLLPTITVIVQIMLFLLDNLLLGTLPVLNVLTSQATEDLGMRSLFVVLGAHMLHHLPLKMPPFLCL